MAYFESLCPNPTAQIPRFQLSQLSQIFVEAAGNDEEQLYILSSSVRVLMHERLHSASAHYIVLKVVKQLLYVVGQTCLGTLQMACCECTFIIFNDPPTSPQFIFIFSSL